ncbi:hypothetical protein ACH5RR_039928 [Cinchona calisaya]|uniref:Uncharacterized protein n=1 Tax=Cinchona calisaya TaxID=153742 RepID=A0ABD2Y3R0_9GENT
MTSSSSKFNSLLNFDHLQFAIINFRADWTAAEYSVHPELHHKLGNIILQLDHWSCLKTILIYIHKCFNIDGGKLQNLESLVKKMEAVSEKITKELQIARAEKFILERPLKALNVLRVLEINIEIFKPEIGQVLEYLFSLSSSSLEFQSSLDLGHLSHLDRSLQSVRGILRYIWAFVDEDQEQQIDAFQTKVFSLQSFLLGVLDFEFGSCSSDPVIDHFFSHVVGSLAVRIAYQSYHYWIKATDETTPEYLESNLRYLQREIDPSTPGFWDLTLKFLTSINMITNRRHEGLAHSFVCYLIHWDRERDILPTLKSLVTYAINEREESGEDVQSLSAEIKALLRLAHSTNLEEFYFCFCLLGIEVFVKEQLRSSSTNFLKEQNQIKELNESSNFARNFSCDLPEENIANGFLEVVSGAIRKVEYLYQSFHAKRVTEKAVRASLLCLLLEIVFTKAETYASELLVNDASLMAFGKDRIETINQGLDLFEAFIRSQRMEALAQGIQAIFLRFEAAARRGTSLYYSFLIEQTTEEMMQKGSSILFSDLLDKMKIIKYGKIITFFIKESSLFTFKFIN